MDRTIVHAQEQLRSFDFIAQEHDTLTALAAFLLDALGEDAVPVVAGLGATEISPTPDLSISIGAGRIYSWGQTDEIPQGQIPPDSNLIVQQGIAIAQTLTLLTSGLSSGQSQWVLVQANFSQVDAIRSTDPDGGVVKFWNPNDPSTPYIGPNNSGTPISTVRQGVCVVSLVYGTPATTGSEVPPDADAGAVGLYLINLAYGQTQVLTADILVAGPSVGLNVPNNYPAAPFFNGILNAHHSGEVGQAPQIDLTAEVANILPMLNLPASNTLGGLSAVQVTSGNPNGLLSGNAATSLRPPDSAYDYTNNEWYTCVTTGNTATTVWLLNTAGLVATTFLNPWYDFCVDGGTTNHIVVNPVSAVSLTDGTILRIRVANTNNGPVDIVASGSAAAPVYGANGTALQGNECVAGAFAVFQYSSARSGWMLTSVSGTLQGADGLSSHHAVTQTQLTDALATVSAPPAGMEAHIEAGSGSFTVPPNVTSLEILAGGAGAGSGGADGDGGVSGSGGGGGVVWGRLTVTPGQVIAWVVGAGGAGGATSTTNGSNGADTTFGGTITAGGGTGGQSQANGGVHGAGGTNTAPVGFLSMSGVAGNSLMDTLAGPTLMGMGGYSPFIGAWSVSATKRILIVGPLDTGSIFTMPPDFNINSNRVHVWGGGGSGGRNGSADGGGAGGGAYSFKSNVPVAASANIQYRVGSGGAAAAVNGPGADGGFTCFNGLTLLGSSVSADFGRHGLQSNHGGAGGLAANGIGDFKSSGGTGADGGGGGGAGGPNGDGQDGSTYLGGGGDAGSGGAGGNNFQRDGSAGAEYSASRSWDGLAYTAGVFSVGSGGGGRGNDSGGPHGGGGAGGLYGGGSGGRRSADPAGNGGQGAILIEYEPLQIAGPPGQGGANPAQAGYAVSGYDGTDGFLVVRW